MTARTSLDLLNPTCGSTVSTLMTCSMINQEEELARVVSQGNPTGGPDGLLICRVPSKQKTLYCCCHFIFPEHMMSESQTVALIVQPNPHLWQKKASRSFGGVLHHNCPPLHPKFPPRKHPVFTSRLPRQSLSRRDRQLKQKIKTHNFNWKGIPLFNYMQRHL